MMSYGFKPELSEGSIKSPIFQTSTFVFKNAQEGKAFFEVAYGLEKKKTTKKLIIYGRINNPIWKFLKQDLSFGIKQTLPFSKVEWPQFQRFYWNF